jgi:hypothetical protein
MNANAKTENAKSNAELRLVGLTKLIELAEEQRDVLVKGRHSDLEANIREQDSILSGLAGLPQDETEMPESRRHEVAVKTSDAANRLRSLVRVNAELLRNAKEFVDFSIGVITRLTTEQPSYNPTSNAASTAGAALMLDSKV